MQCLNRYKAKTFQNTCSHTGRRIIIGALRKTILSCLRLCSYLFEEIGKKYNQEWNGKSTY